MFILSSLPPLFLLARVKHEQRCHNLVVAGDGDSAVDAAATQNTRRKIIVVPDDVLGFHSGRW